MKWGAERSLGWWWVRGAIVGFSENLNPSIHNRGGIQSVYKQPAAREISSKSLLTLSSTAAAKALASSKSAGQMRGPSLATHCIGLLTISDSCARVGDSGARPIGSLYHNVHGWTGALTCEKESEVRSENDSEEEETYLVSTDEGPPPEGKRGAALSPRSFWEHKDGIVLLELPGNHLPGLLARPLAPPDVGHATARRRARSEARTTARRRRLTP